MITLKLTTDGTFQDGGIYQSYVMIKDIKKSINANADTWENVVCSVKYNSTLSGPVPATNVWEWGTRGTKDLRKLSAEKKNYLNTKDVTDANPW